MTKNTADKLYRRHRASIFRYFYRMGGNYHLAEELTQETFYQAAVSLDGFRGESALSTWLSASLFMFMRDICAVIVKYGPWTGIFLM